MPVIASLNGTTPRRLARATPALIEQAGADALELNVYYAARPTRTRAAPTIEDRDGRDGARRCKAAVRDPAGGEALALLHRRSPTSRGASSEAGADGLVLFNRFYQPDIDLEELEVAPRRCTCPTPSELPLRLRWLAHPLRAGARRRWPSPAACTPRVDAIKAVMAGAHAVQIVSALLRAGPGTCAALARRADAVAGGARVRLAPPDAGQHEPRVLPRPRAYERANYMLMLQGWRAGGSSPGGMMDLTTTYLGLSLRTPFMPGASPLTDDLGVVRELEDMGAGAIVLRSLFEEQVVKAETGYLLGGDRAYSLAEGLSFMPAADRGGGAAARASIHVQRQRHFRPPGDPARRRDHDRPRHRHRTLPWLPPRTARWPASPAATGCSSATATPALTSFTATSSSRCGAKGS